MLYKIVIGWLVFVNALSFVICIYDKYAAQKRLWRISENCLLTVSILGGSVSMLLTMCAIRHKTRHEKFMLGIPLIIILQVLAIIFFYITY